MAATKMTARLKLTAKRQATLPRKLCQELNVEPGDAIEVERRAIDGKAVWCLKPVAEPDLSWMGRFKAKARGKRHDMESIRRRIRRGIRSTIRQGIPPSTPRSTRRSSPRRAPRARRTAGA